MPGTITLKFTYVFAKDSKSNKWEKTRSTSTSTSLVTVDVYQRVDSCRNVGILFKVAIGFSKQASSNAGLKIPES